MNRDAPRVKAKFLTVDQSFNNLIFFPVKVQSIMIFF